MRVRYSVIAIMALVSAMVLAVFADSLVSAYYGRADSHGYFKGAHSTDHRWKNVMTGSPAVPNSVNSKEKFIDFVKGKLNGSSAQNKMGASLIINVMIGNSGRNSKLTPNAAMISDWESRVRNPDINFRVDASYSSSVNSAYAPDINDMVFYNEPVKDKAIVFTDDKGETLFALRTDCANPLGELGGLPPSAAWSASGNSLVKVEGGSYVESVNVNPGQRIRFQHKITLTDKNKDKPIDWYYEGAGTGAYDKTKSKGSNPSGTYGTIAKDRAAGVVLTVESGWTTVGNSRNEYCQRIVFTPKSSGGNEEGRSQRVCAAVRSVPPGGSIDPWVTVTPNGVITPETTKIDVSSGIRYSGSGEGHVQWRLYRFKVNNSTRSDASKFTPSRSGNPCSGITSQSSVDHCTQLWSQWEVKEYDRTYSSFTGRYTPYVYLRDGDGNYVLDSNGNRIVTGGHDKIYETRRYTEKQCEEGLDLVGNVSGPDRDRGATQRIVVSTDRRYVVDEVRCKNSVLRPSSAGNQTSYMNSLQTGDQLCYFTSVRKGSANHNSEVKCLLKIQIPFAHVTGGDLRTGSALSVSGNRQSNVKGLVMSSSVGGTSSEYAVLSPGRISGVGSASGAFSGTNSFNSPGSWSALTMTNNNSLSLGQFGAINTPGIGTFPNMKEYLAGPTGDAKGVKVIRHSGSLTLSSSGSLSGYNLSSFTGSVVLVVSGTVNIGTPIQYAASTGKNLNQLVIIANNIGITNNVERVDAWLIAPGGEVDTCADVSDIASTTTSNWLSRCGHRLTVNGPVVAKTLALKRPYFNTASNKSLVSETLNLRSDAYIWAYGVAQKNAKWQTTYTMDLPPRF